MKVKKLELIKYPKNYDCGAYAWVVFNKKSTTATKVFKNNFKKEHIKNVFNSEVKAYEIAVKNEELSCLVPAFYGKLKVTQLNGSNENFIPEYAYEMEYIKGRFVKLALINSEERVRITKLFSKYGINYMVDASVLLNDLNKVIKIIDFSKTEHELWA